MNEVELYDTLKEAMSVLSALNSAGRHTLKTIDRHVALTDRWEAIRSERAKHGQA